jgi:hypothetical protein
LSDPSQVFRAGGATASRARISVMSSGVETSLITFEKND